MAPSYFDLLTRRDTLFALGVCLVLIGVVLRGLIRGNNRLMALRKEHALHLRKLDEVGRAAKIEKETDHLEKYLPRYATAFITIGIIIFLAGFFR